MFFQICHRYSKSLSWMNLDKTKKEISGNLFPLAKNFYAIETTNSLRSISQYTSRLLWHNLWHAKQYLVHWKERWVHHSMVLSKSEPKRDTSCVKTCHSFSLKKLNSRRLLNCLFFIRILRLFSMLIWV